LYLTKVMYSKPESNHSEAGFNLVEGAIVLSLVSALIGALLIGRELTTSGKIISVMSELAYFTNAQHQFTDKYKYRPGDIPSSYAEAAFVSGYTIPDCIDGNSGDGQWDISLTSRDDYATVYPLEVDYAFNQLSQSGFIKQNIDFDPCSNPSGEDMRVVGEERPASDVDSNIGYTFINALFMPTVDGEKIFLYSTTIGKNTRDDADMYLQGGAFPASFHRQIDAKIDQPDTPWRGKYIVDENCYDDNGYNMDADGTLCTGNLVEINAN